MPETHWRPGQLLGPHLQLLSTSSSLPSPQSRADVVPLDPFPLGGVWGRVAEENLCSAGVIGLVTGGGVDQWAGSLGRIAADSDSEMDVTLSSQSSDHPLRDSSLLDKLVYSHPLVRA